MLKHKFEMHFIIWFISDSKHVGKDLVKTTLSVFSRPFCETRSGKSYYKSYTWSCQMSCMLYFIHMYFIAIRGYIIIIFRSLFSSSSGTTLSNQLSKNISMHLNNSLFSPLLHLLGKQSTVAQVSQFLVTSQRADFLTLSQM